jgi:predicted MPP superfamily phosphohydrolase
MNRRRFLKLIPGAVAAGAACTYPVFIEPSIVRVNKYRVPIPRLPKSFNGFTIVHLTDLHHGPLVSLAFLKKVLQRADSIPRDLTICTGDYVHERDSTGQIDRVWPLIEKLRAPHGVFSTLGNHDHWADTERSVYWLKKTGQDLRHKSRCIELHGERLWFVGAGDLWEDHKNIDTLMSGIPENECRIVLAHNPDTADSDFDIPVDLMVCGHTHGGQVRIPFAGPPVLPVKNKRYSSGLKKSNRGMQLFISRGIGWAVYPVRFNCLPEIAVLELVKGE